VAERALIVGGGIGGLATAHALLSQEIEVLVFEQADDVRKIQLGGGFHIWTNAARALQQLGLYEQVQAIGAPLEITEYRTHGGRLLTSWPVGEIAREHGVRDVGVSRQDLQALLVEAVGVERIRLGARCTGFEQDGKEVRIRLADGSEEQGSLLIAADGLRSTIRAQLHGASAPRYAGYTQWQSLVPDTGYPLPAHVERVLFGPGSRAILHRVGGERLFWAAVLYGKEDGPVARAGKETLLERFAGWQEPLTTAIAATPPERIARLQIYDREPLTSWGIGRVTLLGDAAHPMTTNLSQGACQVLEDAAVLARCLRDQHGTVAALRSYEQLRIQRTSQVVKQSAQIARVGALKHPLACAVRNRMTALTLGGPVLKAQRRFVAVEQLGDRAGRPDERTAERPAVWRKSTRKAKKPMTGKTEILWLADGRGIALDTAGPQDGVPVFFCHSLFSCRLLPQEAVTAAERQGVRLISPDRPGIGLSDFQRGRAVLDWPSDVAELADRLEIERFRLFGVSAGSAYVLASCVKTPERVARAAIACGLTPVDEAGVIHRIVPRAIDPAVKHSLLFSRCVHRLLIEGMRHSPERAIESLNKTLPPGDREVLSQPELSTYMIASAVEAARRGLKGWAYDDWVLNEPWGFAPGDVPANIPVDLWWGSEDESVPIAHGERMAGEMPSAILHVREGAGHFGAMFGHLEEIFAQLVTDAAPAPLQSPGAAGTA
jgi:2-polyprenyl-6-methoxyphenol hydroxylase-like FAD-dependent oxidoreductase/pimeloyl-ACP methyl ester carboxylesterase